MSTNLFKSTCAHAVKSGPKIFQDLERKHSHGFVCSDREMWRAMIHKELKHLRKDGKIYAFKKSN